MTKPTTVIKMYVVKNLPIFTVWSIYDVLIDSINLNTDYGLKMLSNEVISRNGRRGKAYYKKIKALARLKCADNTLVARVGILVEIKHAVVKICRNYEARVLFVFIKKPLYATTGLFKWIHIKPAGRVTLSVLAHILKSDFG